MTLNDHWGYHGGDTQWKTPSAVVGLLAKAAMGKGNLLLNIGPRGDGSVPDESQRIVGAVGKWLQRCGECIYDTDKFTWGLMQRTGNESDWSNQGPFTRKGRSLYQLVRFWPGEKLTVAGLNTPVESVTLLGESGERPCRFEYADGKVVVSGLPADPPDPVCSVMRFDCREVPVMYLTGGMRVPAVEHAPYDPVPSDMLE